MSVLLSTWDVWVAWFVMKLTPRGRLRGTRIYERCCPWTIATASLECFVSTSDCKNLRDPLHGRPGKKIRNAPSPGLLTNVEPALAAVSFSIPPPLMILFHFFTGVIKINCSYLDVCYAYWRRVDFFSSGFLLLYLLCFILYWKMVSTLFY